MVEYYFIWSASISVIPSSSQNLARTVDLLRTHHCPTIAPPLPHHHHPLPLITYHHCLLLTHYPPLQYPPSISINTHCLPLMPHCYLTIAYYWLSINFSFCFFFIFFYLLIYFCYFFYLNLLSLCIKKKSYLIS